MRDRFVYALAIGAWFFTLFVILSCKEAPMNHGLVYQVRCYSFGKMIYENTNAYSYQRKGDRWIIFSGPRDFVEVSGNCVIRKFDLYKG